MRRTWQLTQFLSDNWTVEKREHERVKLISDIVYMSELKNEYPKVFDDGILKLP